MQNSSQKRPKAVYQPGELDKVRKNIGPLDVEEAKRMVELLGGEVGIEKSATEEPARKRASSDIKKTENSFTSSTATTETKTKRNFSLLGGQDTGDGKGIKGVVMPLTMKISYRDRVAMDALMAQRQYQIKTSAQAFFSKLSFFGEPVDKLNPNFFIEILPDYCMHIEKLVIATRKLLPQNRSGEPEKLSLESPLSFEILNLLRSWDIKALNSELIILQKNARNMGYLQCKMLARLMLTIPMRLHFLSDGIISSAFIRAYKILEADKARETRFNPTLVAKEAISEWTTVRERVVPNMYPLLLRLCSPIMLTYQELMQNNFSRIKGFLQLTAYDFIQPPSETDNSITSLSAEQQSEATAELAKKKQEETELKSVDESSAENTEAAEESVEVVLPKSVTAGLGVLEKLFPEAGWNRLNEGIDFYSYFQPVFKFVDGVELFSPQNPLQLTFVLLRIIEELLYGFRTMKLIDSDSFKYASDMSKIINEWRFYRDDIFDKKYIPYIKEYCHQIDIQPDFRFSNYGKRVMSDMSWITKQYFFSKFKSGVIAFARPVKHDDVTPLFKIVNDFKRILTSLAASMEQSIKEGKISSSDPIEGLSNPWALYVFQVENPVSRRLNLVLGGKTSKARTNANLIYYTLSVLSVLDWWINSSDSYAYLPTWQESYRRKSETSVAPDFTVSIRPDVKEVFIRSIRQSSTLAGTVSNKELSEIM